MIVAVSPSLFIHNSKLEAMTLIFLVAYYYLHSIESSFFTPLDYGPVHGKVLSQ